MKSLNWWRDADIEEDFYRFLTTFWYTTVALAKWFFPQSAVMLMQHESGTVFPSAVKALQSAELFAPQHFN